MSFSDTGARSTIRRAIANADSGPFLRLKQFSSAEIEAAFVESRVRTLWLYFDRIIQLQSEVLRRR